VTRAGDLLTIEELIARAELEPSLIDVYVEGESDAAVFRAIFAELGIDAAVFPVRTRLDIRRAEVDPYSSEYGNRTMLITAAMRADAALRPSNTSLTFVIDADWAQAVGPIQIPLPGLISSDLPSMEHYFLEDRSLRRFLTLGLMKPDLNVSEVKAKLKGCLQDIAAARLTLENFNIACVTKIAAVCDFTSTPTTANADELVRLSFDKVPRASRPVEFATARTLVPGYRQLVTDADHPGRGHDIAPLLISMLSLTGQLSDPEMVETLMRASSVPSELLEYQFFRDVATRVAA